MGICRRRAIALLIAAPLFASDGDGRANPRIRRYTVPQATLTTKVAGPFVFTTDLAEEEINTLAQQLLELDKRISTELRLPRLSVPVRIYLFQERSRYLGFVKEQVPALEGAAVKRRALFLLRDGQPHIFLYSTAELNKDLRHEFTHALLNTTFQKLPIWVDEGLAVFYESEGNQAAYRATLRDQLRRRTMPSLVELDRLTSESQMGSAEYAIAWSWVDFFLLGPADAQTAFKEYLADMQKDMQAPRLPERLTAKFKDPDGTWKLYAERLLMGER